MMRKVLFTIALTSALAPSLVHAKSHKHIVKTLPLNNAQEISINVPVGHVELQSYQGETVELSIELEPKNNGLSFFKSSVDLDDVELTEKNSNGKLSLTIDDDNINQHWVLKVPMQLATSIDLGVGEVSVSQFSNTMDVNVGVGEVTIHLLGNNYQEIELDVGVGDSSIHGFAQHQQNRHLVGSTSHYFGEGEYKINVSVGVGDAEVSHK